ncbi:MAG: UDP-N-acetylmuramate dehydrogenase [Balneolaceae bacterium]|nr:UDP-N-acetylmuramate dehydrogenase [Balneolaceae bacterium]MBO6547726.1 UDP-N-acetylmuramate dehydrogenase [Balneolaceae bacterium]MBO6648237.1 UDP-N-acetylmuramate dehydrogenase [Balneolaceae bacterium]
MTSIQENFDLSNYNTMGLKALAHFFVEIHSLSELKEALEFSDERSLETLILGGGSNILFVKDFKGLVILNRIKGIQTVSEDEDQITLKIGAGENWHQLVRDCVAKGYGGIENLSLIPGTVGAAPIQNIGAYGVELVDVFVSLEAYDIEQKELKIFTKEESAFGYRDSIFKKELKGKVVITSVTLRLSKNPELNFSYSSLKERLDEKGIQNPALNDVSEAVIEVRQSKLPDPDKIGNTGSFFKNPVISVYQFDELKSAYSELTGYPISERQVKVPAGWLIEQAGWKGKRKGDAGVHSKQALVLVNHGSATGEEIWKLANEIIESIHQKFDIRLIPEVNILGLAH